MDISARIKFFREQKGYTVNRLANIAGISQSYLRSVELGQKNPTVETLSEICWALDISLKDFFDDDTLASLQQDELLREIYRLTPKQRQNLANFLKSL
ncbi:MAG TPA: helix-turn-helix domain-containing protein [Candidatus Ruthenibacterium merdavium]|uniref:Helix-turn-helix domain-containing protein n=1 Tax=Candidatus Ruthenibacterium merdavium TaxID=2838752 RepID=A0A9D2Q5F2_9FIRM|nr:helix-turn-helix domain-containing protein [Candidatus Ruthenibacterium merdavium]